MLSGVQSSVQFQTYICSTLQTVLCWEIGCMLSFLAVCSYLLQLLLAVSLLLLLLHFAGSGHVYNQKPHNAVHSYRIHSITRQASIHNSLCISCTMCTLVLASCSGSRPSSSETQSSVILLLSWFLHAIAVLAVMYVRPMQLNQWISSSPVKLAFPRPSCVDVPGLLLLFFFGLWLQTNPKWK